MARIDWSVPALRETFKKLYYAGKSFKEIGEACGTTEKNAFARSKVFIDEGFIIHRSELPINHNGELKQEDFVAKPEKKKTSKSDNPFEIKTDMTYSGVSGDRMLLLQQLANTVLDLDPKNKKMSLSIPKVICDTQGAAQGLIQQLRKMFSEEEQWKHIAITIKTVKDAEGKYIETRIWRRH